ncbi:MAG: hypothetical protein JST36_01195 [Bacteroidetes bacterium]|nr:hypothetical protein [Bacteroidota bacterium]
MLEQKNRWIKERFGNVNIDQLGNIRETKEIIWPNLIQEYEVAGRQLKYQMLDVHLHAPRIAEIYQNAIDEMVGNSEYEWHHDPKEIISHYNTGNWNFYGCFYENKLIAVESLFIIRGQRTVQWVWGCVDPVFRSYGVWHNIGKYNDQLVELSHAEMGLVWVATTHPYSQMTAEAAGYRPIGCFVGGEFLGGSDGKYYRQNVIYYSKLYNGGLNYLQNWEGMKLTDSAKKLVDTIKDLWE